MTHLAFPPYRSGLVALLFPLLLAAAPLATPGQLDAETVRVGFDIRDVVVCRDVTPESFALMNPDEKVVEAEFLVSVWMLGGDQLAIDQLAVLIVSPTRRLRVRDFDPKAEDQSDIRGAIDVAETQETEKSRSASIGGSVAGEFAAVKANIAPSLGSGKIQRNTVKESYQRIPPKLRVLTSGTITNEHGVMFKLKPSPHESLEGVRRFTCRFVVPLQWRGDWTLVTCRARKTGKKHLFASDKECGYKRAFVGLYLQGDPQAKAVARRLSRTQARGPHRDPLVPTSSRRRADRRSAPGDGPPSTVSAFCSWLAGAKDSLPCKGRKADHVARPDDAKGPSASRNEPKLRDTLQKLGQLSGSAG